MFISLQNCSSKPNHTVAIPENKLETFEVTPGTINEVRTL